MERCVALLAAVRGNHLLPRHSFYQLLHTRRARASGRPVHLLAHEEVLIYQHTTGGSAAGPPRPDTSAAGPGGPA